MEVAFQLPEHKFQVSDFVRFTRDYDHAGFLIIGQVFRIDGGGKWELNNGNPVIDVDNYQYAIVCQVGSLSIVGATIRPGTIIIQDIEEVDEYAEKIEYNGVVWTEDSPENLDERIYAWEAANPNP